MARATQWVGLAALGLTLTGCASQGDLKTAKAERDQALAERDQAFVERDGFKTEVEAAKAESESFKNQLGALAGKEMEVTELSAENAALKMELDKINDRYAKATDSSKESFKFGGEIPEALKKKIEAFAAKNKEFVEFDAAKGLVRFKSDATFSPGSAELTPKGKEAVAKLAEMLTSEAGKGYELMVAGHTDATQVTKPSTIKKGHFDNWYLSAHRAISVGRTLQAGKVAPQRMAMVGYAEQRPVASNASEQGRALNRRVEVLILPTMAPDKSAVVMADGPPPKKKKAAAPAKQMKEKSDGGMAFNK